MADGADVEFVHLPAAAGGQQRQEAVVGQLHFLAAVEIQVFGLGLDPGIQAAGIAFQQAVGGDQVLIDGVAEVRQVNAAEGAVPVAAVALAAVKFGLGLIDQSVGRAFLARLGEPAADVHHPRVHLVGFGVLDLEVSPVAAADEAFDGGPAGIVHQVVDGAVIYDLLVGGQGPLGHLAVAAVGQVDLAERGHVVDGLGQRGDVEPILVGHERVEEPFQPAVVVDVFLGFGPGAELLSVVAEDDDRIGLLVGDLAQVVDPLGSEESYSEAACCWGR